MFWATFPRRGSILFTQVKIPNGQWWRRSRASHSNHGVYILVRRCKKYVSMIWLSNHIPQNSVGCNYLTMFTDILLLAPKSSLMIQYYTITLKPSQNITEIYVITTLICRLLVSFNRLHYSGSSSAYSPVTAIAEFIYKIQYDRNTLRSAQNITAISYNTAVLLFTLGTRRLGYSGQTRGEAWASYQIRKIAGCACTANAGNVFPATDFKGNR